MNRYSIELHLADKLGALNQLTAMMPDWTAPQKVNVVVDLNFSGRRGLWRPVLRPQRIHEASSGSPFRAAWWLKNRLSNSFGYHARAPSRSAFIEQDAQAREAIRVRDQPDDLKQHIPLETGGKASGQFLKTAGLIADRLPSKPQDP